MKIAVIPNTDKRKAILCGIKIAKILISAGACVIVHDELMSDFQPLGVKFLPTYEEIFEECDCAVTVGGDGTIIRSARLAAKSGKSVLGVNLGRLGYVAELEATEISMLKSLVSGEYETRERMILDVTVIHKDGSSESHLAVNDAVISRGSLSRIIDLDVYVEGEKISDYRADGLLFSTPTGSTAYALSAGGPVIDPYLNLIELTPVCPHSLAARTVIFNESTVIHVVCNSPDTAFLTVDGQISVALKDSDTVRIKKSEYPLKMNVLKSTNFYKVAGDKLTQPNK